MMALHTRQLVAERMDDPELSSAAHMRALRGLERIHRVSGTAALLWPRIAKAIRRCNSRPARVLDVAAGSGPLAINIARRVKKSAMPVEVIAGDISQRALNRASQRAASFGIPLSTERFDAVHDPWPSEIDIVVNSLFLHHLTNSKAVSFLKLAAACARDSAILCDLRRTQRGLLLAQLGTRMLSRSTVVHFDGPQSVRAAFTAEELERLIHSAGIGNAVVQPMLLQRQIVCWRRTDSGSSMIV